MCIHTTLYGSVEYWTSWGRHIPPEQHLKKIVVHNDQWHIQDTRYHADDAHVCYGTHHAYVPSTLHIPVSVTTKIEPHLAISFDYIHSWNTSYIANSICTLYKLDEDDPNSSGVLIHSINITSNICEGRALHYTGPCPHQINLPLPEMQRLVDYYTLQCHSIEQDKLACISTVKIIASEEAMLHS